MKWLPEPSVPICGLLDRHPQPCAIQPGQVVEPMARAHRDHSAADVDADGGRHDGPQGRDDGPDRRTLA
jgi:hypothetical protein